MWFLLLFEKKHFIVISPFSDSECSPWQECEEEEGEADGREQNSVLAQGGNADLSGKK